MTTYRRLAGRQENCTNIVTMELRGQAGSLTPQAMNYPFSVNLDLAFSPQPGQAQQTRA